MSTTMKAIVYHEYGSPDVLHITEMEKPTPKDNDILIKIVARSVNYGDIAARDFPNVKFNMPAILGVIARLSFGWNKPRSHVLGSEFAGIVEAVGNAVTKFKEGDHVFGYLSQNMGANAEYITIAENGMVTHKPENVSFEEAAAIPYGALTAYNLLKRVDIQAGQKVLINGASGSIGAAAVRLAKYYGAEVTGVSGARSNRYVEALGADHVIDYKKEDFTQNGEQYDVVMDILGRSSFKAVKRVLKANGRYLLASFKMKQVFQSIRTSFGSGRKVIVALSLESAEDLEFIRTLIEEGHYKAIVDRCFPFDQAAEAHRYYESGQKQGSVIIQTV